MQSVAYSESIRVKINFVQISAKTSLNQPRHVCSVGYSLIYNPWLCLIFEAMESVTLSLSFTAAVTYAAKLSTTTTDSSIQGLLGGLYFGVGKILLALI
jgi:hypothetical protein